MGTREIHSLHGLRGLAALAIVFFHLGTLLDGVAPEAFGEATGFRLNAFLFVDLFFVLSGFIMGHVYRDRMTGLRGAGYGAALRAFYQARVARLLPLYYATLFGAVAVAVVLTELGVRESVWTPWASKDALLWSTLLLQAWGVVDLIGWNYPSWSISAEVGAYLLFPLLLWFSERGRIASSVLIIAGLAGYAALEAGYGSLDITTSFGVLRAICGFAAGFGLWQLLRQANAFDAASKAAAFAWPMAAVIGLIIHTGALQTPAVAAMLALVAVLYGDRGLLARALTHPVCKALGTYSYAMYLTHGLVWTVMFEALRKRGPEIFEAGAGAPALAVAAIFLSVTAGLSVAAYHLIEKPGRKALRPGGWRWIRSWRLSLSSRSASAPRA